MRSASLAAIVSMFGLSAQALAQDDLAKWVPPHTNTLAIVHVRKLMDSPLGKQEQWSQRHRDAYASGEVAAPPGVDVLVKATEFHLGGEAASTYSLYRTEQSSVVGAMARQRKAKLESISNHSAVRVGDQYFAQLTPKLMGAIAPANRQVLARWLKSSTGKDEHSAFLRDAVLTADDNAQVIIAMDLADMLEPASIGQWLKLNPGSQKFDNPEALAAQFATIQGARLSVHVGDAITGRLKLTFASPVGNHGDELAKLVMAWADETGSRLRAASSPKVTAGANLVILDNDLDLEALRRLMSLIRTSHAPIHHEPPAETATATPAPPPPRVADAMAEASGRYFQAVNKLVDSLNRQNRSADDYLKTATWHENFARQIDSLPTDGVDPELVGWARNTSQQLAALASSLRGVPIEVNQLEKSIHYSTSTYQRAVSWSPYQTNYMPWGNEVNTNLAEVRVKQQQAINRNAQEREAVWQMIGESRVVMNRQMNDKYGTAFRKAK